MKRKIWKQFIAVILSVILCVEAVPLEVWATEAPEREMAATVEDTEADETEIRTIADETVDYTYNIETAGEVSTITITRYTGADTEVVVPETIDGYPVTKIAKEAFGGNTEITKVTLPDSITTMGYRVFHNCTSLTEVGYPKGWTTSLNYYGNAGTNGGYGEVFYGCTSLKSVEVPEGVTQIPTGAFNSSCIEEIKLPDGLKSIGNFAFHKTALKSIDIPETVMTLGEDALSGCTSLTEITIPEGITVIPFSCFGGDTALTKVNLPDTVVQINKEAFNGCTALEKIELPDSITTMGYRVFHNCASLTEVGYPKGWTTSLNYYGNAGTNGGYGEVFYGCTSLKSVEVPEGVTQIPTGAFNSSCIEEVILPDGLKSIGNFAFHKTALKSIDIPETVMTLGEDVLSGCTSLTEITIPEGITVIPFSCFGGDTALTKVNLPDTVVQINKEAFNGCTALEKIELPDSITTMGYRVFHNCTALTEVGYPKGWTTSLNYYGNAGTSGGYGEVFYGCSALKSVGIPEGVTQIPAGAFAYSSIEEIKFPQSLRSIGNYAFSNVKELKRLEIPNEVTSVGKGICTGCANLESFVVASPKLMFDENALNGCNKVTIYCPFYSGATIKAIDYGYPMINENNSWDDLGFVLLDKENTRYSIDTSYISIGGYIANTIEYTLKESKTSEKIIVRLPDVVTLDESTLFVNGKLCTNYKLEDRMLTIPVAGTSGKVVFHTVPETSGEMLSYALMQYHDGGTKQEVIDIYREGFHNLTITAKDTITTDKVEVSGVAAKSANIDIYVDGKRITQTTASKAGKYSATVTIPSPVKGRTYLIKAVCGEGDAICEAQKKVTYEEAYPEVTEFTMHYNNHNDATLDLLNVEKNHYTYFYPRVPFTFVVDMSYEEDVENVYVTSTRNNQTYYMEAEYDEEIGKYVASGYFNHLNNYVPGTLAVQFVRKQEQPKITNSYKDVSSYADKGVLGEKTTVTTTTESDGSTTYNVDMTDAFKKIGVEAKDVIVEFNYSMIDEKAGTMIGDLMSHQKQVKDMFSYFVPGLDDDRYIVSADYSDPTTYLLWVKDIGSATDKITQYKISLKSDYGWTSLDDFAQDLSKFNTGVGIAYDVAGFYMDYEDLRTDIMRSTHIMDKENALKRADQLYGDQVAYTVTVAALGAMAAAAGGPAAIVFSALLGMIGATSSLFWEYRTDGILGAEVSLRWAIDPSGYVYEGVTSNRVSGAKVTAYYRETLDVPEKDAIIWNASEFDQVNPLYTDAEGRYAWDVPEGYWQVKCEKEGYETSYSEWLPVPPPQTEVHLRMIPTALPEVELVQVGEEKLEVIFNLYMDPATISGMEIKDSDGKVIAYTLEYDTSETDLNGNVYAKKYTFRYNDMTISHGSEVTVSIPDTVKSADAKTINAVELVEKCKAEMKIVIADSIELDELDEHKIPFFVENYDSEKKVTVTSEFDASLKVLDVVINEDGTGYILASKGFLGEVNLTVAVEGTTETKTILVKVTKNEHVHQYTTVITKKPTCAEAGIQADVCICGDVVNKTELEKLEHIHGEAVQENYVEATCAAEGSYENVIYCTVCSQEVERVKETIPTIEHEYKETVTKATTVKNGSIVTKCKNCGTVKSKSTIYKISSVKLSKVSFVYDGKVKKPVVTVKNSAGKTIGASYYTVTYAAGRKNAGRYKVTVKFKTRYSGTVTKTFDIVPKGTSISSLTKAKKSFTIKWKKQTAQTNGYQIQYSTNKKFSSNVKNATVSGNKTMTKKITGLKAKKLYYVRIRTYKTVKYAGKNIKIYSGWSKVKSVKTK